MLKLILKVGSDYEDKIARPLEMGAKEHVSKLQLKLLLYIQNQGLVYMSELSGIKQIAKSQVTAAIQDLVEDGLVERVAGEKDRRKIYVRCTGKGELLLRGLQQNLNEYLEGKIDGLADKEKEELAHALKTVLRILEEF